jgi:hypothetical protein
MTMRKKMIVAWMRCIRKPPMAASLLAHRHHLLSVAQQPAMAMMAMACTSEQLGGW